MLGADREADGVGLDALVEQLLSRKLAVGGGGRMDHQGLHVGHVCQQGKDFQTVDKLVGFLLTTLDFKGEDGAAAVGKILLIQRVVGMLGQGPKPCRNSH